MALDDVALGMVAGPVDLYESATKSLIRSLPATGSIEAVHAEFKVAFVAGPREWGEIAKDIVALANSGGGVLVFGISDSCKRVGLAASLVSVFDPAKITDQLRRSAPSASIGTAYVEVIYYRKRYGALVVHPVEVPIVFDVEWSYTTPAPAREIKILVRPGVLYVRTPGRSAPANQTDFFRTWQRSVDLATERKLARIQYVARLPTDAEVIVSTGPSTDKGFVVGSGDEGRPVRIVDDPLAPAVRLSDVLTTDVPYSSVGGELASQTRQWQTDSTHRVSRQALMRWWLQRADLELDDLSAQFCVLSAAADHGYPMYWASKVAKDIVTIQG